MSVKIGIVCEGISDFRVLKHVTERSLRDVDAYVIPLQPKETAQGKQDGFGSWQGVLDYLRGNDQMILEAYKEGCRYVIVHIDTDVRNQYGLHEEYTNDDALHSDVVRMLMDTVHPDFNKELLLFAVAINETECWLLSFITSDKAICCKTESCVNNVNRLLKGKVKGFIDKDNKNALGARATYEYILKNKKKPKDIKEASLNNCGFAYFINSLDKIKEHLS